MSTRSRCSIFIALDGHDLVAHLDVVADLDLHSGHRAVHRRDQDPEAAHESRIGWGQQQVGHVQVAVRQAGQDPVRAGGLDVEVDPAPVHAECVRRASTATDYSPIVSLHPSRVGPNVAIVTFTVLGRCDPGTSVMLVVTSSVADWYEEEAPSPLAAGHEEEVLISLTTNDIDNEVDAGSAISENAAGDTLHYLGYDGESTLLGPGIFGHDCVLGGTLQMSTTAK